MTAIKRNCLTQLEAIRLAKHLEENEEAYRLLTLKQIAKEAGGELGLVLTAKNVGNLAKGLDLQIGQARPEPSGSKEVQELRGIVHALCSAVLALNAGAGLDETSRRRICEFHNVGSVKQLEAEL